MTCSIFLDSLVPYVNQLNAAFPSILSVETFIGFKGVLPFRGTFSISNLIPEPRLGFSKTRFSKNYGVTYLRFSFLFYFPFKIKIK